MQYFFDKKMLEYEIFKFLTPTFIIQPKNLEYDFTIITADLITIVILKLLLIQNKKTVFIIKLPEGFIENKDYLSDLIERLYSDNIKDRICLNIDYKSALRNKDVMQDLKTLGFKLSIYDMKKLNKVTYLFKNTADYMYITEELKRNSPDVINFCDINSLTFFEEESLPKKYIKEEELLK